MDSGIDRFYVASLYLMENMGLFYKLIWSDEEENNQSHMGQEMSKINNPNIQY